MSHPAENDATLDGHDWDCGECGERITGPDAVSDEHSIACSLHPENVT